MKGGIEIAAAEGGTHFAFKTRVESLGVTVDAGGVFQRPFFSSCTPVVKNALFHFLMDVNAEVVVVNSFFVV